MSAPLHTEKTIFLEAAEIASPTEREAFLERSCGDDRQLRAAVEALLLSHQRSQGVLDATTAPLAEHPGTIIGPYKLLQQIGEGGMGTVFMAEQTHPVQRKVAVKVIKPGMDSHQIIARFEAERQALAMMDHVNIARVLDAGTTPDGLPYFVMELVHGVPITKYCDDNHLTPRERLELFVPVCQAIQHAHQKGIIHRDVKPSNVMITLYDGKPVPKVIDFGVAKATEQKLTERTLFTQYGTMVGTLEYMSPEQAEMSALGVDTRSDIYSLGVLLYELLTGSTPLSHKRVTEAAYAEILRLIKEEEPPKPSTRLSESGEALASISAQRHMEPAKLSKLMRGELDWIVMKTLEKDRNRRYETANGLAMDVERYLTDEPVLACPPSAIYRFQKFARRNKAALISSSLVAIALLAGTLVSTWQAVRATRLENVAQVERNAAQKNANRAVAQERIARQEADRAREAERVAHDERVEAENQRAQAEANYQKAKAAVNKYFTLVSESTLLDVPGLQLLRKDLLEAALEFYQGAALERSSDPAVLVDVASTYLRVSSIYVALNRADDFIDAVRRALDVIDRLHREHTGAGDYERKLAGFWNGKRWTQGGMDVPRDILGAYQTMVRLDATWKRLVEEHPSDAAFRMDLSYVEAMLGSGLAAAGRTKEAIAWFQKGHAIAEKLVDQYPDIPEYRANLADGANPLVALLAATGSREEAQRIAQRCAKLGEELVAEFPKVPAYREALAQSLRHLGNLIAKTQPQEAEQAYRRALAVHEKLVADFPNQGRFLTELGKSQLQFTYWLRKAGKSQDIEKLYRQTIERWEKRLAESSATPGNREILAHNYWELGDVLQAEGRWPEAVEVFRQSLDRYEELAAADATQPYYAIMVAQNHRALGNALRQTGQLQEAEKVLRQAIDLFEQTAKTSPALFAEHRWGMEQARNHLIELLKSAGRTKEAEQVSRQAVAFAEKLTAANPRVPQYRLELARLYSELGDAFIKQNKDDEAIASFRKALELDPKFWWAHSHLAELLVKQNKMQEALAEARQAVRLAPNEGWPSDVLLAVLNQIGDKQQTLAVLHEDVRLTPNSAHAHYHLGMALKDQQQTDEAIAEFRRAIEICEGLITEAKFPNNSSYKTQLALAFRELGSALATSPDRRSAAEEAHRRDLDLWEKLAAEFPEEPVYLEQQGHSHRIWGYMHRGAGEHAEAIESFQKAIEVLAKSVATFPNLPAPGQRGWLADTYHELAVELVASKRFEEGEAALRQAIDVYQKFAADVPHNPDYELALARCHNELATLLAAAGRPAEAEQAYERILQIRKKLTVDFPDKPEYRNDLADSYLARGDRLMASGKSEEAEQAYRQTFAIKAKLAADFPNRPDLYSLHLSDVLWAAQRRQGSEQTIRLFIELCEGLVAEVPNAPDFQKELARCHNHLGLALAAAGRLQEAEQAHRRAEQVQRQALELCLKLTPEKDEHHRRELAWTYMNLGNVLNRSHQRGDAEAAYRQALALCEKLDADFPADETYRNWIAGNCQGLAIVLTASGRPEEAEKFFRRLVELNPKSAGAYNDLAWLLATGPDPKFRDPKRAVELAQKAVELAPKEGSLWNTLGTAQYRAGDWAAAVVALEKSGELRQGGDSFDWFFLAMAHWQLGEKDAARKCYDQGVAWMEKNKPEDEELKRFREEAAELLGVKDK